MEFVLFVIVFGALIVYGLWSKHASEEAWAVIADKFDFEQVEGGLGSESRMSGELDGVTIRAYTETRGAGKNRTEYSIVEAEMSGIVPVDLELGREGILQKLGKVFGGEDIQVGDPDLDSAFIIKGINANEISKLLRDPEVKQTLLEASERFPHLVVEARTATLETVGRLTNAEKFESCLRTVAQVAAAIEEGSRRSRESRQAKEAAPGENTTPAPPPEATRDDQPTFDSPDDAPSDASTRFGPVEPRSKNAEAAGDSKDDWW